MSDTIRAKEMADAIGTYVNSLSQDASYFIEAMSMQHRTLQQSFTRLCLKWLEHVASEDYWTDGRNEASQEVAKALLDGTEQEFNRQPSRWLPFI